jgi:hypothetical protein
MGVPVATAIVDEGRGGEMSGNTEVEADAVITKFFQDLKEHRCPQCGAPAVDLVQVGRCIYTHPCGHRIGQGTLADLVVQAAEAKP